MLFQLTLNVCTDFFPELLDDETDHGLILRGMADEKPRSRTIRARCGPSPSRPTRPCDPGVPA